MRFRHIRVVFYNSCGFDCNLTNWRVKDEGRKDFIFPEYVLEQEEKTILVVGNNTNKKNIFYWKGEDYVWTSSGDTLFLRDSSGRLVLWRIIE